MTAIINTSAHLERQVALWLQCWNTMKSLFFFLIYFGFFFLLLLNTRTAWNLTAMLEHNGNILIQKSKSSICHYPFLLIKIRCPNCFCQAWRWVIFPSPIFLIFDFLKLRKYMQPMSLMPLKDVPFQLNSKCLPSINWIKKSYCCLDTNVFTFVLQGAKML